jgi:hypothetical protein
MRQMDPVHATPPYLSNIHINIILTTSRISFGFPTKMLYAFLLSPHASYMPCSSHPPWLDHSNYIWRRVQLMKLLIMQFIRRIGLSPRPCVTFRNKPPLVGCRKLLIKYVRSYRPYQEAVPSIRNLSTRHAVVTKDPLTTGIWTQHLRLRTVKRRGG